MKEKDGIVQFLSMDEHTEEDFRQIVSKCVSYHEYMESIQFRTLRPRFYIFINKFLSAYQKNYPAKYSQGLAEDFREQSKKLDEQVIYLTRTKQKSSGTDSDNGRISDAFDACVIWSNRLENKLLDALVYVGVEDTKFSFFDFYVPESANRKDAEKLIERAIQIIRDEKLLTAKAKAIIVSNLAKALQALRDGKNTDFLGISKEIVIILGALGSFVGGYVASLHEVRDNLDQAFRLVEESSIETNNFSLNECMKYINIPLLPGQISPEVILPEQAERILEGSQQETSEEEGG